MEKAALHKVSYGLYVVGVRCGEGFGGCVVDAFMQATDAPPTALLCSMQRGHTRALIHEHRAFTVSILPVGVDPMVIANFGLQSSRTVDKWANVDYALHDGLPALACACAGMRLRVSDARELSTHTLFYCDIEDAWQGEGEPMLYADYQRSMKPAVMAALQALKARQ